MALQTSQDALNRSHHDLKSVHHCAARVLGVLDALESCMAKMWSDNDCLWSDNDHLWKEQEKHKSEFVLLQGHLEDANDCLQDTKDNTWEAETNINQLEDQLANLLSTSEAAGLRLTTVYLNCPLEGDLKSNTMCTYNTPLAPATDASPSTTPVGLDGSRWGPDAYSGMAWDAEVPTSFADAAKHLAAPTSPPALVAGGKSKGVPGVGAGPPTLWRASQER